MTEIEYFRLLAPEFAGVVDADVNKWLLIAGNTIDVGCLDVERQAQAKALYAAHLLRLTQTQAVAGSTAQGAVIREKEGDLERTYGQLSGGDSWIGQTVYGQQFKELTRVCSGMGILTRVTG